MSAELTKRVNQCLIIHGLRWCSKCAPAEKNEVAMLRIIETGKIPRRKCILPLEAFPGMGNRLSPWCSVCRKAYARDRRNSLSDDEAAAIGRRAYKRLKNDPVRLAAARAKEREYSRKRRERAKTDADVKAVMLANQRRWREKMVADEERHRRWCEDKRIDYRLKKERDGALVLVPKTKASRGDKMVPMVPLEPFAIWLEALLRVNDPEIIIAAAWLEMNERKLFNLVNRCQSSVSVDMIDRALLAVDPIEVDGRLIVTFDDLYVGVSIDRSVSARVLTV